MQALRVMAGFQKDDGYWLPRSRVIPSRGLQEMIWPWLEDEYQNVFCHPDDHPTADQFLRLLGQLRVVLLQDVAAMMVIWEGDSDDTSAARNLTHTVLQARVFQTEEFLQFKAEMKVALELAGQNVNDPNLRSIDRAFPGVSRQFEHVRSELRGLQDGVAGLSLQVEETKQRIEEHNEALARLVQHEIRGVHKCFGAVIEQRVGAILDRKLALAATRFCAAAQAGLSSGISSFSMELFQQEAQRQMEAKKCDPEEQTEFMAESDCEQQKPCAVTQQDSQRRQQQLEQSENEHAQPAATGGPCEGSEELDLNCMRVEKNTLRNVYDEYFGFGSYSGKPVPGGFHAIEVQHGTAWRAHFITAQRAKYSRITRLAKAVVDEAGCDEAKESIAVYDVIQRWERHMTRGLAPAVNTLQAMGKIPKPSRKKAAERAVETTSVE